MSSEASVAGWGGTLLLFLAGLADGDGGGDGVIERMTGGPRWSRKL